MVKALKAKQTIERKLRMFSNRWSTDRLRRKENREWKSEEKGTKYKKVLSKNLEIDKVK